MFPHSDTYLREVIFRTRTLFVSSNETTKDHRAAAACLCVRTYPECLLQAAIVGDILASGHLAVDSQVQLFKLVGRVLIDYTFRLFLEGLDGGVVPPLLQVSVLVELPT